MYQHFQQDFLIIGDFTTVFFDPEPAGDALYYHLTFNVQGRKEHLIMEMNEFHEWEMLDRDQQGRYQDYELQFKTAIVRNNLSSDGFEFIQ